MMRGFFSKFYLLSVSLLILSPTTNHAQDNASEDIVSIDLIQALEKARENYPLLKKRVAEKLAAGEDLASAMASYYPRIGAQAQGLFGSSNQVRGPGLAYDGLLMSSSGSIKTNGYDWQGTWTSALAAMVDWQAFTFGRKANDRSLGEARQEAVEKTYEQELFEHQIKVADAYLLALNARKYVQLQERALRRTEDIVSVTRANASSGLKAGIDSSLAVAESTRALLQLMDSQAQAKKLEMLLGELIGEAGRELELDTMQFFSQLPSNFDFASSHPENHPRLQTLAYQQKVREYEIKRLRLGVMPELHLMSTFWGRGSGIKERPLENGDFEISSSLSGLGFRAWNYAVGATLVWHPSRIFQIRKQVSAEKLRYNALREQYNAEYNRRMTELKNSDIQFNLAYQSIQKTPIMLDAARQAYAQSLARYENGLENILLLTQVSQLYIKAETEYLLSVNNFWRTLLMKAAAKGDFNVFLEQIPNN